MSSNGSIPWLRTSGALAWIAYSNAAVPLVAAGLTVATYVMFDLPLNTWGIVLAMSGAFLIYAVERSWLAGPEDIHNRPDRVEWLHRHRVTFAVVAGVVGLVFAAAMLRVVSLKAVPVVLLLCLAAAVYCLPILPGGERLKGIWYLKPVLIAAAWTIGTVLLPVVLADQIVTSSVVMVILYRFLFLLPNTLLADVPDIDGDRLEGLSTAAMRLGPDILTMSAVIAALIPFAALVVWMLVPVSPYILADSFAGPILAMFIWRARPLPRIFYILHIDLLVALPLVAATLFNLAD